METKKLNITDWLEEVRKEREISFKVGYDKALGQLAGMTEECKQMGRKEVVEWVEYYLDMPEIKDTYADKIIRPQLKSKLKEWGV